jgi:anti-anti-sigma factor
MSSNSERALLSNDCSIQLEEHLGTITIRLFGEFDLACEERFRERLSTIDRGAESLVLDLRDLEFIDSAGLRVMVELNDGAERDGLDFVILCGDGQVRRVLRESGLEELLPVVDPAGEVPPRRVAG